MTRLYARAPRGHRVHDAVPGGHWKMLTILGALGHTGMLAVMTVEAATDREVFLAYLDQVLCPKLRARPSTKPSNTYCPASPHRMHRPGSDCPSNN